MSLVGRVMLLVLIAPVVGIFSLIASIFAPALIVLATVLLYFNSTLATVVVAVCATAFILVLIAIGYVHADRRYDSPGIPISERWALLLTGAFAPVTFVLCMTHLSLGAILRWFVSAEIAATLAGLIMGCASAINVESANRDFPLP